MANGLLTTAGDIEFFHDTQNGRLTGTRIGNISDTMLYNCMGELSQYTAKLISTATVYRIPASMETKPERTMLRIVC